MRLGKDLQRRLLISFVFGLMVVVVLAVVGDVRSVASSFRRLDWRLVPVIFGLAVSNYVCRFLRWTYYLRTMRIALPASRSLVVFMSGLAMSITPGKMGELVKCYFLKRMTGTPLRRSAPIVFAERFTDFFSVVVLAAVGGISFRYGQVIIAIGLAATTGVLVLVMNRRLMIPLIRWTTRFGRLQKLGDAAHDLYDHAVTLLRPGSLAVAFILGFLSWFCECVGLFVTIRALGDTLGLWESTFIYAFSTLFGAITLLPGGLGTTEGSLAGLLLLAGLAKDTASAATILVRLATLWFAVGLGLLWLAPNRDLVIPDRRELETDAKEETKTD